MRNDRKQQPPAPPVALPYVAVYATCWGHVVTFTPELFAGWVHRFVGHFESDLEAWEVGQLLGGN